MSDDLARFPTPKEAFRPHKKTSHISPAFEQPSNIPPPPQHHSYRVGSAPQGVNGYYSNPATPDGPPPSSQGNYRAFSGPQPQLNQQFAPQAGRTLAHHASQPYLRQGPPPAAQQRQADSFPGAHMASSVPSASLLSQNQAYIPPGQQIPTHVKEQDPQYSYAPSEQYRVPRRPVREQFENSPASNSTPSLPAQPAAPLAPKSVDLRSLFDDVDRHKRGYLTERELSKALVNGDYSLFDAHTVRLMMKMFDRDGDGAIYFAEFGQLWKYLHDWRQVFDKFDTNHSDSVSSDEFRSALAAFGYTLTPPCIKFMFNAGSRLNRQGQREMSFDLFVQSCISIKSITDTFKKYDTDRDGFVTMGFEDFLIETTKLH